MLNLAVELGIIEKPEKCEFCKQSSELQAHHHDYRLPLDVAWFCRKCHSIVHALLNGKSEVVWLVDEPHAYVKQRRIAGAKKSKSVPRGTKRPR